MKRWKCVLIAGGLDSTFGIGGKVLTDFPASASDSGADVAIQPGDGKFVVAGTTSHAAGSDFALARYNPRWQPRPDVRGRGARGIKFAISNYPRRSK